MKTGAARQYVLTLSCPNTRGIVHAVSSYLLMMGGDIVDSQQFGDQDSGLFFMRVHFEIDSGAALEDIRGGFAGVGATFRMDWQIHDSDRPTRTLIMVSQYGHCLNDLLFRMASKALPVEIAGVISNHTAFEGLVTGHGIPFHHIPVTGDDKAAAEARLLEVVADSQADLVVLARYMRILSADVCKVMEGRIINIHHSFLPSFKGAKPYHQAHSRGVKLIGATAHYVTPDLDEGPIIEQDVIRVRHDADPARLVALGRDVENRTLARAVGWHAEHRILLNGTKTVVFS
ncbi:formyltetrahydrofolate deformylase [Streptomyces sp. NBC_01007]|nr:formyltetrahydrofolate deformylase [Streptomyces sp. NBC_01007]WRZ95704.1 formyltetrahydrofolate deformylase [Streptomyces sp. NBC_01007]